MKVHASVTVFTALIFTTVSALLCALAESARTEGTRFYLRTMADAATDSLFSEYHNGLWENYRLLGRETADPKEAEVRLAEFMKPYRDNAGWYALGAPSVSIPRLTMLTEGGGYWFEKEVEDYMKFGWIDLGELPLATDALMHQVEQAHTMNSIINDYGGQTRSAHRMERALSKVRKNISTQSELKRKARSEVRGGDNSAFQRTAGQLELEVRRLPELIRNYSSAADAFSRDLARVESSHSEDMDSLDEENRTVMEERLKEFHSYVDEDGPRRLEVEALDDNNDNELSVIASVREFADETEEYIEEHEDDDDEEDGDGIDEDALWEEVAEAWDGVPIPVFSVPSGMKDEETADLLEAFGDTVSRGFLHVVLPPDRTCAEGTLDTADLPSTHDLSVRNEPQPDPLSTAVVCAYAGEFLPCFTDEVEKPLSYELEYALAGKDNDRANLSTALVEILAVREGLNFLAIITDEDRFKAASDLASHITGENALPALTLVVGCLVVSTWALAESLYDLRLLLKGKKCAIFKLGDSDWMTSAQDLIRLAATRSLDESILKEPAVGMTYELYLDFLLTLLPAEQRDYRIMDMVQSNLVRDDRDFRLRNCIYGIHSVVRCESKHIFLSAGIGIPDRASGGRFPVSVESVRAY